MRNIKDWSRFTSRRLHSPPLKFLTGLHHALKPGYYCPMHSHPAIEIVYHPAGRGITRTGKDRSVAFDRDDIVVYAPHELHDQTMETAGDDLCLRLGVPRGERGVPRQCFHVPSVKDATIISDIRILSRGQVRLSPAEQAIFNLRATSTLYALVHLAFLQREGQESDTRERYATEAEHYLRNHFTTIKTLREAAQNLCIGYDHLRHVYKERRGRSLICYLNEIRVDRAKSLLIHSKVPLKQVASMCGFKDEYYFSSVFRKVAGRPPGRYRAQRA
jgi:AraC-like DNA-binding protein